MAGETIEFDMKEINLEIHTIAKDLGLSVRAVVGKIALDTWGAVIRLSPVDTGRYRNSWMLSENTPTQNVAPEGVQGPSFSPGLTITSIGQYPIVYLSNALPYAQVIEEGHSTMQAPQGVLKVALAAEGLV